MNSGRRSVQDESMVANTDVSTLTDVEIEDTSLIYSGNCITSCYGLPYQDHNYGAPPPPTPPPSPGKVITVSKKGNLNGTVKPKREPGSRKSDKIQAKTLATPVVKPEPVHQTPDTPEEAADDSITRCICSFTHDDGYMICCDKCQVWQHIDCMGIDRSNIPEEYLCEKCLPRKVSKVKARALQKRKLEDVKRGSSEEECIQQRTKSSNPPSKVSKLSSKLCDIGLKSETLRHRKQLRTDHDQNSRKKNRHNSETLPTPGPRARRNSKSCGESVYLSVDGDTEESPWSVSYESASTNQYSTDIQEALKPHRINGTTQQMLPVLNTPLCCLRLLINGRRGLEVNSLTQSDQPLIEFRGKVMLRQQYVQENDFLLRPHPFVLFYNEWDKMEISVDASTYGNEARFIRRSCVPNAEVHHVIRNGELHLIVYSTREIAQGAEVTIPFDYDYRHCVYCVECACIRAQCPVRKAARKLQKSMTSVNGGGDKAGGGKITSALSSKPLTPDEEFRKTEALSISIPKPSDISQSGDSAPDSSAEILSSPTDGTSMEERRRMSREERKLEAIMKAFEKLEKREERRKEALQRIHEKKEEPAKSVANQKTTTQPTEHTDINKNIKPVTAAQRRRRNRSGPARQRVNSYSRTSSLSVSEAEPEENSNLDPPASSTAAPLPAEVGSTSVGTIGFRLPKTKKDLLNEWYHEKGLDKPLTVQTDDDNVDFVKTVTSPLNSWAHLRRNSASSSNSHNNVVSPAGCNSKMLSTSMGSAKKRWLHKAMTEEADSNQSLASPVSGPASPNHQHNSVETPLSPGNSSNDFVTPLKKRRMARESMLLDRKPVSPSSQSMNSLSAVSATVAAATGPTNALTASDESAHISQREDTNFTDVPQTVMDLPAGVHETNDKTDGEIPHTVAELDKHSLSPSGSIPPCENITVTTSPSVERNVQQLRGELLSPKDPHTSLHELMKSACDPFEVGPGEPSHSMSKQLLLSSTTLISNDGSAQRPNVLPVLPDNTMTLSPVKAQVENVLRSSPAHSDFLCRSVSMVTPCKDLWNSSELPQSVSLPSTPMENELSGLTTATPPAKKKVSLLEYRKRMKDKGSSETSPARTSSSVTSFLDSVSSTAGSTLPSLPLFEHLNSADETESAKCADVILAPAVTSPRRPAVSLDERLKMEFGLEEDQPMEGSGGLSPSSQRISPGRVNEEFIGVKRVAGSSTPPPPPPPLPLRMVPPSVPMENGVLHGMSVKRTSMVPTPVPSSWTCNFSETSNTSHGGSIIDDSILASPPKECNYPRPDRETAPQHHKQYWPNDRW